jgi:plasmid maintenance system antidote protein VapI
VASKGKVEFMREHKPTRPIARCPSHPGAVPDDIIRERKPVSPAVATRLGKMFRDGAAVWLRIEALYDAWHAERDVDVTGVPTLRAA